MPENRKEYLGRLWHQVQQTEESTNFGKLKRMLNFRNHPDVQTGRKYQDDLWK
ncbi:MAG: hypothetical protein KDD45_07065 [Bdellovibrionales bacterium]|nr:hypothetical protein [Bdellovibrionales bacterium]